MKNDFKPIIIKTMLHLLERIVDKEAKRVFKFNNQQLATDKKGGNFT